MKHSIEWHDDGINAAPEERLTVGDLRLFVERKNATQHLLEGQPGDHVTVALAGAGSYPRLVANIWGTR